MLQISKKADVGRYTITVALTFVAMFTKGCGRVQVPPQKSPDGNFTLSTTVNDSNADPRRYLCVIVDIKDAGGKTVYHKITPASDTQGWSIRWLDNNKIELASSDIGTHHIRRQADGNWTDDFPQEE